MSILIYLFLALMPYAASITFNFTNITQNNSNDIVLSGDAAYTPGDGIRLTYNRTLNRSSTWLVGRATYKTQLHLWDNNSNLASFSTSFTFVINSYLKNLYGDGLTFFLAQNNSLTRNNSQMMAGGSLGLPIYGTTNSIYPFVAVEFDTYGGNQWDPTLYPNSYTPLQEHVGINNNSLSSVAYRKWLSNITYGKECRALINYYADSKNLSVSFTNFENNTVVWETGLNYTIDLRDVLPEWVIFGFSASTGDRYEEHNVRSWAFNSTKSKVNEHTRVTPTTNPNVLKGKNNTLRNVTLIVGPLVLVIIAYLFWRRRMKNNGDKEDELGLSLEMNNEFEMGGSMPRRFSYHELARATADFAETGMLGEGGFGGVYKGFLRDLNIYVAVKRVSKTSKQGIKEYASEVKIISRLRHRNLVKLIGWCHEKGELMLVYEFMENGSLDLHLFKGKSLLTWNTRYKIAHDLCSALLYLHEEWEQCVLHRDIKSSNVMLDQNFNAKLGDFGLAKLVDHEKGSDTTMLAGTLGYMAPECAVTCRATKESDVFSFGVVALEIACGRKAIVYKDRDKDIRLVEWAWDLYGNGNLLELTDPRLGQEFEEEEIRCLITVGLWCVHPNPELRPSMRQAVKVLKSEASLPLLPSKMPVTAYLTLSAPSLSNFTSLGQYQSSSGSVAPLNTESTSLANSSSSEYISARADPILS